MQIVRKAHEYVSYQLQNRITKKNIQMTCFGVQLEF